MVALVILLLAAGVAGALLRPWGLPAWTVPVLCVVVALSSGAASLGDAHAGLAPLAAPIGFLLAAVPLAVMLDRLGFFAAAASRLSSGPRAVGGLWVLAALVTTVLNLDASVVLLTPLYVNLARKTGRDPLTLSFQPVMLACLASSALPVSNLTNLIAVSATGASTTAFLAHLGFPSLLATAVGWVCYRHFFHARLQVADPSPTDPSPTDPSPTDPLATDPLAADPLATVREGLNEPRALLVGGTVVTVVLSGFVGGRYFGIEPWMVALGADVVMVALLGRLPWRTVPVGTALVAGSLALLAAGAVARLRVRELLVAHTTTASIAAISSSMAVLANVINNLPALLVTLPAIGHSPTPILWAVLIGVNMGPVLLVTGSLASLLWLDSLGRLGVTARAADFTRVGLRVGLPAAASGLAAHLALHAMAA